MIIVWVFLRDYTQEIIVSGEEWLWKNSLSLYATRAVFLPFLPGKKLQGSLLIFESLQGAHEMEPIF